MLANPKILSFNCVLKDKLGTLISSSVNRDVLTSVSVGGETLAGLANGLRHLSKGEHRTIELAAAEAYGFYDPKKVVLFPRKMIPNVERLRPGQAITIVTKTGEPRHYKVLDTYGEMISLDGNHPLAGQDLVFEIDVTDSREATEEEICDGLNTMATQRLH